MGYIRRYNEAPIGGDALVLPHQPLQPTSEYECITPTTGSIPDAANKVACGCVAVGSRSRSDRQQKRTCPVMVREGLVVPGYGP